MPNAIIDPARAKPRMISLAISDFGFLKQYLCFTLLSYTITYCYSKILQLYLATTKLSLYGREIKRVAGTAAGLLPLKSLSSQLKFQLHLSPFQLRQRTLRLPSGLRLRTGHHLCHHPLNTLGAESYSGSQNPLVPCTKQLHFLGNESRISAA